MFVERPLFPPFKFRNLWCGCSDTNEMIGQSFPASSIVSTLAEGYA